MRRLLTGRGQAERTNALRAALYHGGEDELRLLVGPTLSAARELTRGQVPVGVQLGVHRLSFRGLARELAAVPLAEGGRMYMHELSREALAARALGALSLHSDGLGSHLAPVLQAPGLARALSRTLDDLRRFGVGPEALEAADEEGGVHLAWLFKTYQNLLEEQSLADYADVLRVAAEIVESGSARWSGWPLFLLDVAPADPSEERLIRALASRAPSVTATLAEAHPDLDRLQSALEVAAEPLVEPDSDISLFRSRRYVFTADEGGELRPRDESLRFYSSSGEAREAVDIARGLLRHAQAGTPFDRMAVLLREPDRYESHLRDALHRAEIPAFFTRKAQRPAPPGRALLALIDCALENLSAERFSEYLSLGEVPLPEADTGAPRAVPVPWVQARDERQLVFLSVEPEPTGEPPLEALPEAPEAEAVVDGRLRAPRRWEQLIVDASVVGGRERWARRLAGLARELTEKARRLRPEEPARAARIEEDLAALGHLERFTLPLIERLSALPSQAPWPIWVEALEGLAAVALRAPAKVLRVLAELRGLGDSGLIGREEVRVVLRERLSFLTEDEREDDEYGRVWVGALDEVLGRSFEVVFLPGLAEGLFPQQSSEDPLLLDEARARLSPDLPRRRRLAEEERTRLRIALGSAERVLEASYPRLDTEKGRPRVPSFYALDLLRAAEGVLPSVRALGQKALEDGGGQLTWPAPLSADAAVDGAEYDLAVLARGLRSGGTALDGVGRYLVGEDGAGGANPHLARSLRMRAERWRKGLGPADGLVDPNPEALSLLSDHRLKNRSYSASALQQHAACPYRFYLYAILRLRPREKPVHLEQMDPLIRGSLIHDALFRFFVRLREEGFAELSSTNLSLLFGRLAEALEEAALDFQERLAPAIPAVWKKEVEDIHRDLRGFLRREVNDHLGFIPSHAELAFGLEDRGPDNADKRSVRAPVITREGYLLRGSIDLVERRPSDERLRITDYKSGRRGGAGPGVVRGGQVLQPLLYAEAAEVLLDAEAESARLAYCTSKGGYHSDYYAVGPNSRARLVEVLKIIDSAVEDGFFPAAPAPGACRYCDFRPLCGPSEELRFRGKRAERFSALSEIRSLD